MNHFKDDVELISGVPDSDEMWDKQRAADFLGVSFYVFNALCRDGHVKVYKYNRTTHRVRAAEVREFRERSAEKGE